MENHVVRKSVLFLCTHNAVRSQTAEALFNKFTGIGTRLFAPVSIPPDFRNRLTSW
ncbi:MAG TPA: hypothetical protein PKJ10_06595 [Smithella sp.]|nr:hypothetical protein [Smithella sp.]